MDSKADLSLNYPLNYPQCIFMGENQLCNFCGTQKLLFCFKCNDIRAKCSSSEDCVICLTPTTNLEDLIQRHLEIFSKAILSLCKKHRIGQSDKTKILKNDETPV